MSVVERVQGGVRSTVAFLVDVRAEIGKVTWPGKDELRRATLVILAFVMFVALLIGLIDIVLQFILVRAPGGLLS